MAIKKSQDTKYQLYFWSRLLESRIALQNVLVASRELEKIRGQGEARQELDDSTEKSISKLLASLVKLRDSYRNKSQFCDDNCDVIDPEIYSKIDDNFLDERHDSFVEIRDKVIQKWYEKTKIGTIPKKGYTALELPTLDLIRNALKDKKRLIKKTQLDRTLHSDDAFHPETFNDDDFYHQLLKEVISKEEGRKWVELQRLRYKVKRKADTKATKGRKIKKDLIPKLVNFMAPYRPINLQNKEDMPERIRAELIRSLFGGKGSKTD